MIQLRCFSCLALLAAAGVVAQRPTDRVQTPPSIIRADVRLVEVYATIYNRNGRYVSGLAAEQFEVRDNGEACPIVSFEPDSSGISCAILLDRTGSMEKAFPAVKNSTLKLIDAFRDSDWFAIYGFSSSLQVVQDFSQDRAAAKSAVLGIVARGATAFFDAICKVAMDLSGRKGKKAIIAFTDGQDNISVLNPVVAASKARSVGVPLFAVAQGEALEGHALLDLLRDTARHTGGEAYAVKKAGDIEEVFQDISKDLGHTYMLAYHVPRSAQPGWRSIQLTVKGSKGLRIRSKENYYLK